MPCEIHVSETYLTKVLQVVITEYHRLGDLQDNRSVFLIVMKAEKSKIKVLAYSASAEASFWFVNSHLFSVPLHERRSKRALWGLFIKTLIPFVMALPS